MSRDRSSRRRGARNRPLADRARSEYRLRLNDLAEPSPELHPRPARELSRDRLATVLLASYRGTVDDEGEDHDDALVAPERKGRGIGRDFVLWSLHRLRADDIDEVGATMTNGNEPSERLFTGLGFTRIGPWPPVGG